MFFFGFPIRTKETNSKLVITLDFSLCFSILCFAISFQKIVITDEHLFIFLINFGISIFQDTSLTDKLLLLLRSPSINSEQKNLLLRFRRLTSLFLFCSCIANLIDCVSSAVCQIATAKQQLVTYHPVSTQLNT